MNNDWRAAKLKDLCDFKNGLWKGKKEPFVEVGIIRNTNFTKSGFLDNSDVAFHDVEIKQYGSRKLQYGDIVLEKSGGGPKQAVGRVAFFDLKEGEYSFSNFTSVIRIKDTAVIEPTFLHRFLHFYYLSGLTETMQKFSTGIRNLQLKEYQNICVPIPPLKEQKRIVAILDEAFAGIEQAIANTEKNIQNIYEIFESYLDAIFIQEVCADNLKKLEDVIDVLTDYHANGSYKILKQHVELKDQEDFAWMVRSTDFENNFENSKRYIDEHAYNFLTKSQLLGGEIIMSKIGNAGKVYLMPEIDRPCSLAMNLFLIRLNNDVANNEYVFRYLNSRQGKNQIQPLLNGAATQTITKDSVKSLVVPLPSVDSQRKSVQKLRLFETKNSHLVDIHKTKLNSLNELKQSLLQKAFAGELTSDLSEAA